MKKALYRLIKTSSCKRFVIVMINKKNDRIPHPKLIDYFNRADRVQVMIFFSS